MRHTLLRLTLALVLQTCFVVHAHAEGIPTVVFEGLKGQEVHLEREDGSELTGRLLSFDDEFVVIAKSDGRVVTVERGGIDEVSLVGDSSPQDLTTPPASAPPAGTSKEAEVLVLQQKSRDARTSGIVNLAVWTPISVGSALGGYYLINEGIRRQEVGILLPGVACLAFGATGVIMFPIRGGTSFHRSSKYGRQAADLEASAALTPVWLPGGGGAALVGSF